MKSLQTITARLALPVRRKPYWHGLARGLALGYRRNVGAGTWIMRKADGKGKKPETALDGIADDHEPADGKAVLSFDQAQAEALRLFRGKSEHAGALSIRDMLEKFYGPNREGVGKLGGNVSRVVHHLPKDLADRDVAEVTEDHLSAWAEALTTKETKRGKRLARDTVNRTIRILSAAFTMLAKKRKDLNPRVWKIGLEQLENAGRTRKAPSLSDAQVVALIEAAMAIDPALGLFIEVGAETGARPSQIARIEVEGLDDEDADHPRLMIPPSNKGKHASEKDPVGVWIPPVLAASLRVAAGGRGPTERLLLRDVRFARREWDTTSNDYADGFAAAVAAAGLPAATTFYWLRHTSIKRMVKRGIPIRLIADSHETSVKEIERTYSLGALSEAGDIMRASFLERPAPVNNVVALRAS